MEYIHKAKAEKNRTKLINDQMEARRVKNRVIIFHSGFDCPFHLTLPCTRLPASVVKPVSRRRDKRFWLWRTMLQYRSDHFLFAAFTLVPMLSSCMPIPSTRKYSYMFYFDIQCKWIHSGRQFKSGRSLSLQQKHSIMSILSRFLLHVFYVICSRPTKAEITSHLVGTWSQ